MTPEQIQALLSATNVNTATPAVKESNFDNTQLYVNGHYIGNFSMPKDFAPETVTTVETFMANAGIEIRREKAKRQALSLADLVPQQA